jgi:rRNA maturation protein Nop10
MPSNQPETPTPDALDAAVEEARERVGHWITRGYADLSSYEHAAINALVAAVEASAVARERQRECVWTQRGTASWNTQCGEYIIATFRSARCDECGGRVRVVDPAPMRTDGRCTGCDRLATREADGGHWCEACWGRSSAFRAGEG